MLIKEALISLNTYPIPDNTVEKICIDRGLVSSDEYTVTLSTSEEYELATADLYMWLHSAPSLTEQEVGVNNAIAIKENMLSFANKIYAKYDDEKFSGNEYGFIGEDWNG